MKLCRVFVLLGFLSAPLGVLKSQPAAPAGDSLAQYDSADSLWNHILELREGPAEKPKSKEEFAAFIGTVNVAVAKFVKKYPNDPRKWDAMMLEVQTESMLSRVGQQGFDPAKAVKVAKEVAAAKAAPKEVRKQAALFLLADGLKGNPEDFEKALAAFEKEYPGDENIDQLKLFYAQSLAGKDTKKATAMYKELAQSKDEEVAAAAKAMMLTAEMIGKPVDIKFTAVDGTEVDVSKMKGNVVLIDFWATWCGPCMQEVPNLVKTYEKYHSKGFDIVGISLDQSKDNLLEVTKEKGMTWPQYFDGEGWKNAISTRFGITSIPQMWLIDKKGNLVTTEAREDLEGQVEKLLGAAGANTESAAQ
ncbi:hypothetical protein BH09VER1_BH09VER1_48120 [soil metagenome]